MRNLLIDEEYIDKFVIGAKNIESSQLLPAMWVAQSQYIEPLLGDRLCESIDNSLESSPVPTTYTKLIELIRRSLGYYTLYVALDELDYKTKNAGINAVNPNNTNQISDRRFDEKRAKNLSIAESFRATLIKHLQANASAYGWEDLNAKGKNSGAIDMFGFGDSKKDCKTTSTVSDSVWEMKVGNTFVGETIVVKQTLDGITTNVNLTGYTALGQFRNGSKTGDIVKTITFGTGITETDLDNGTFDIDSFICDFEVGTYCFDILLENGINSFTVCIRTIFVEQVTSVN